MHNLAVRDYLAEMTSHETWPSYVRRITEGLDRKQIAAAAELDVSGVSRWLRGTSRPSPEKAINFARSLLQNPVEALVAAGYLDESDTAGAVQIVQPLEAVSTEALLEELRRRTQSPAGINPDAPPV